MKHNNEVLVNIIRKAVKEELKDHEKKFCEILKSHLETANQILNKILDEVVELTKSLKFTLRNYQYKRRFKSSKN